MNSANNMQLPAFSSNVDNINNLVELDQWFDRLKNEEVQKVFARLLETDSNIHSSKLFLKLLNRLELRMAAGKSALKQDTKSSSPTPVSPTKKPSSPTPASPTKKTSSPTPPEQKEQFTAVYKDQKFILNRRKIENDGDCALTAMRLTRAKAAEILEIEIPQNAKVRSLIAGDIHFAISELNFHHIIKNTKEEKEFSRLLEERKRLDTAIPPIMDNGKKCLAAHDAQEVVNNGNSISKLLELLKKHRERITAEIEKEKLSVIKTLLVDAYTSEEKIDNQSAKDWVMDAKRTLAELVNNMNTKIPDVYEAMRHDVEKNIFSDVEDLEKAELSYAQSLKKFSLEIPVQQAFLKKHIKTNGWMLFNIDSTSSLDAIAELYKKHIIVFCKDTKNDSLNIVHEHKPAKVEDYEIIFMTDQITHYADGKFIINKNTHYDRLEPLDAASFEKTIGFVRKSVSPVRLSSDIQSEGSAYSGGYFRQNLFSNPCLDSKYKVDNKDYDMDLLGKFHKAIVPIALKNEEAISPVNFHTLRDYYRECHVYYKNCPPNVRDVYTIILYQILIELYIPRYKDHFKDSLKTIVLQAIQDGKSANPDLKYAANSMEQNPYLKKDLTEVYEKNLAEFTKKSSKSDESKKHSPNLLKEFLSTVRLIITESPLDADDQTKVLTKWTHYFENFEDMKRKDQISFIIMNYEWLTQLYHPNRKCYQSLRSKFSILVQQMEIDSESESYELREAALKLLVKNEDFAADAENYRKQTGFSRNTGSRLLDLFSPLGSDSYDVACAAVQYFTNK